MRGDEQGVVVIAQLHERRAEHWPGAKIEWAIPFLVDEPGELLPLPLVIEATKIGDTERKLLRRIDDLHRRAIARVECGAKDFMSLHQKRESALERFRTQWTAETKVEWNVVRRPPGLDL